MLNMGQTLEILRMRKIGYSLEGNIHREELEMKGEISRGHLSHKMGLIKTLEVEK